MNKSNNYPLLSSTYHRKQIFMISLGKWRENFTSLTLSYFFLRSAISSRPPPLPSTWPFRCQYLAITSPLTTYNHNGILQILRIKETFWFVRVGFDVIPFSLILCIHCTFFAKIYSWKRWETNKRELSNKNHFVQWVDPQRQSKREEFFAFPFFFCSQSKVVKYASKFYPPNTHR